MLNKIDYLTRPERSAATEFLRRALREYMPAETEIPIFELSAREGLQARQCGDAEALTRSGLAEIEYRLTHFLANEKLQSLDRAVATKAAAVLDAAEMEIALGVRALEMPIEDLEQRAAQFGAALREIEQQRLVARDLLAGDRRRSQDQLEEQAAMLRREARTTFIGVLETTLAARAGSGAAEESAKRAIGEAIPEFFGPKLGEVSHTFSAVVEKILASHVRRAETLVGTVRQTAAALFEIPSVPSKRPRVLL